MKKQLIFISHITEEKELALALKKLIEDKFLGIVDVFVSSDENSIQLGQEWLDNITNGLRTCCIELILCSPISITRPWINFEAGAGWVRENCIVIPMCHSNIKPEDLPLPLNLLQGMVLNNQVKVQELIKLIANQIGCKSPSLECNEFISKVKDFEEKYTYWNIVNDDFKFFFELLINDGNIEINNRMMRLVDSTEAIKSFLIALSQNKVSQPISVPISMYDTALFKRMSIKEIFLNQTNGTSMSPNGVFQTFTLHKLNKFDEIINNPNFIYCISGVSNEE